MPLDLIEGNWNTRRVSIAGKELSPKRSQKLRNHSPDGFMWGYGGSGPAQLALAIMLELASEENAQALYQDFKQDFVAKLEQGKDFKLSLDMVKGWIVGRLEKYKEGGKA